MKLLTNSKNMLENLERIGIFSSEDLLDHLPYRYEDMSYTDETELEEGMKVALLGKLVSNPKHFHNGRIDIITFFFVSEKGTFLNVKLFNRPYMVKNLTLGEKYSVIGTYNLQRKEVIAASVVKGEIPGEKRLRSVYHIPGDISPSVYRNLVEKTFSAYQECIVDELPSLFVEKYRLLPKKEALRMVHMPKEPAEIARGMRTLKYHECLAYCLRNQLIRGENKRIPQKGKGAGIPTDRINAFILDLPFKLTADQIQAIREIITDMNRPPLMYRLLQGDVGTGKTIVSATALYGNFLRGKVGAFMVPTDSLARQQYDDLNRLFSKYSVKVGLLIGSLSVKEKNLLKNDLKEGRIDVLVGTHALFSQDVEYPSLGLAVIDEQHRFGVNQRNELISKDDGCDLLLMSATPIPRTLALSVYGDLDISSLNLFPSSERSVKTKVVSPDSAEIFSAIHDCLEQKRQVFIVAPKIGGKDDASAEKLYEVFHSVFEDQTRLLHGRMKSEEKAEILEDFIAGKFLILVSTTVIELGINVLGAGAIIIYSSSRFGLASLHQLRGRVGRDGQKAVCLLVDDNSEDPRLKILEESDDGFHIAEMDMKLRGPGDTVGVAQSGFPTFSCLNIVDDFRMFECARDDAAFILNHTEDEAMDRYLSRIKKELTEEKEITLFD